MEHEYMRNLSPTRLFEKYINNKKYHTKTHEDMQIKRKSLTSLPNKYHVSGRLSHG